MAYYLDLFSPETYETFKKSDRQISGFRERHKGLASKIKPGDKLVCYMTKLSRWFGMLEVIKGPFIDSTPIFYAKDDPFIVRFQVKTIAFLDVEQAVPIHDPEVWKTLSFTRDFELGLKKMWTGKLRGSLAQLDDADGEFLEKLLLRQATNGKSFPIDEDEYQKLITHTVKRQDRDVSVSVPSNGDTEGTEENVEVEVRESIQMQAMLADIGSRMGLKIWLPKGDRSRVLKEWSPEEDVLLDRLPLNYDDATLKTIEQIDVLWLRGRSIVRAFEVEHSTSVYSGILRMADLLALQPNMDIRLHIVAPSSKREKVFQEIRRPVFSLLERGPLAEMCTYISYDSLKELSEQKHLEHLMDSVLEEYAEEAE